MSYVKSCSIEKTKKCENKQKNLDKTLIRNTFRKALKFESTQSIYNSINPNFDEGAYEISHYSQPSYEDMMVKQQKIIGLKSTYNPVFNPKVNFHDLAEDLKLKDIIEELFKKECPNYNAENMKYACQLLSERGKALVKSLKLSRYRYVVDVFAAQKAGQSIMMASRCLCTENTDYCLNKVFETEDYIVSCTIYGFYKV
jgi:hypothetical protein